MSGRSDAERTFWGDADAEVALDGYESLVNTIDDGIYQLDARGRFVAVNDAIVETSGYTREDLIGEHVSLVLTDEDIRRITREITSRIASDDDGDIATFELGITTATGEWVPCELRINPLMGDGEFRGTIGVVRDVSEASERLESLESAQTAYKSIADVLDEANIGVFVLDDAFEIAWYDETIERYLGLEGDLIGRDKRQLIEESVKETFANPDRFAETVLATYDDNSYIERFECHVLEGSGREDRWLEHYSKPIESGRFAGGRIELYYDITDRKRSEGARQETEAEFQSLVDAVEEYAIFRLDPDGCVISWNEGARSIKGYDREEILGTHFSTFYSEEDLAAGVPERNLVQATESGSADDEGWRLRKDGTRFWATVTITAVRNEDGTHGGFLKVTRDMTDRYERERELEGELQQILGRISDGFYSLDEEWRFTHVNETAESLLRRPSEELLGEVIWDLYPRVADSKLHDTYQEAMATQESMAFEWYSELFGTWAQVNVYPSETGVSVYFQDVSERKERERELKQYLAVTEAANDVIVTIDDESTVQTINPAVAEVFGYEQDELIGEPVTTLMPDRYVDRYREAMTRYLETNERSIDWEYVELPGVRVDGSEFPLAISFSEIEYEGERYFTGILRDITERRMHQRKLEASNERLEQFAYAASHDLQEPLRMVSSYLLLIQSRYGDQLDEDGTEFLRFAVDGAERMREMIDGLLQYSRVETQGDPFEPVDLRVVLDEVLADLRLQIEASGAEITAAELPVVEGDRGQLRQVFQNLIDNAIEYSGAEPPNVDVSAERDGSMWRIAVRDEGIGIDPDDADLVFKVFQRLHSPEEHEGTGIGLALCKRIIERHGGDIEVESVPGEGSTFTFTLPVVSSEGG